MTKETAKKVEQATAADTIDELFIIGLDNAGKPQGARFKTCDDRVVFAAVELRLLCVFPASAAFAEIGMKLPPGRLYASGKIFAPNIRRDLYEKLKGVLATPGDSSTTYPAAETAGDVGGDNSIAPSTAIAPCISPMIAGLPRSWDTVLVHASAEEGWWECIVTEREHDVLTLRYRDWPKHAIMVRHISTVALVNPGPL
jgi:hypothetical protein